MTTPRAVPHPGRRSGMPGDGPQATSGRAPHQPQKMPVSSRSTAASSGTTVFAGRMSSCDESSSCTRAIERLYAWSASPVFATGSAALTDSLSGPPTTVAGVPTGLSQRLAAIVDALAIEPDARVLEVGCGPGAAARAVAERLTTGHVLAIDRSATAVAQATAAGAALIEDGRLRVRQVAAEDLVPLPGDEPFDVLFAVRVGALDGRHPEAGRRALARLAAVAAPGARLLVDGGDPLREIPLPPR